MPSSRAGSELAGPFLGPALHHHFLIRIELHSVPPLPVHYTQKAVLPATERKVRHRGSHSDVDAHIAGRRLIAEFARRSAARGEDRGRITVRTPCQDRQ